MRDALLLNASYEPLEILDWKEAVNLLFRDKIEVLENHDKPVRTVSGLFRIPSVCRLKEYVKVKRVKTRFSRDNIFRRDGYSCMYCGNSFAKKDLTYDHVMPKSRGGKTTWLNIATACKPCNMFKGDATPEEAGMRLLQQPHVPKLDKLVFMKSGAPPNWSNYLW